VTALIVVAHGLPAPQGSKRYVGRGILVESSKRVRPWRDTISAAAVDAAESAGLVEYIEGPVAVDLTFVLPRPQGHFRTGKYARLLRDGAPHLPHRLPDLDKLTRAALDAFTDAGVWRDDAQVTDMSVRKSYPGPGSAGLTHPGLVARVTTLNIEAPS